MLNTDHAYQIYMYLWYQPVLSVKSTKNLNALSGNITTVLVPT